MEVSLPSDFNWMIYVECHKDLQKANINDKKRAINHWLKYGHKEKRIYSKKLMNLEQLSNSLPLDFNWEIYIQYHSDLKKANINTEEKAIHHWLKYGHKEKRIYSKRQIVLEDTDFLILNENKQNNKNSESFKSKVISSLFNSVSKDYSKNYYTGFQYNPKMCIMTSYFKEHDTSRINILRKKFYLENEDKIFTFIEANPIARFSKEKEIDDNKYVRILLKKNNKKVYLDDNNANRMDEILEHYDIDIKPWRSEGEHILIILNSCKNHGYSMKDVDIFEWLTNTIEKIRSTGCERRILIRPKCCIDKLKLIIDPIDNMEIVTHDKGKLLDYFENAWCSVLYSTSASVVSIIQGIPVFCECPDTITWNVSSNNILNIENPTMPDRKAFFKDFSRQIWSINEIKEGIVFDKLVKKINGF